MAKYVMSGSTGMIGACATLIGLVKLRESQGSLSRVDEAASITAVAFLVSACLAYLALRTRNRPLLQARLEAIADIVFLGAMLAIVAIGITFAFDLI
jgi:branched-subunit amino acid ABC-type transport system permease component